MCCPYPALCWPLQRGLDNSSRLDIRRLHILYPTLRRCFVGRFPSRSSLAVSHLPISPLSFNPLHASRTPHFCSGEPIILLPFFCQTPLFRGNHLLYGCFLLHSYRMTISRLREQRREWRDTFPWVQFLQPGQSIGKVKVRGHHHVGVWNTPILHQELGRKGDLWKPGCGMHS